MQSCPLSTLEKKVPLRSTASKLVAKSAAKAMAVPQAVEPAPKSVEPLLEQLLAKFAATQKADQEVAFVDKANKGDPASAAMSDSKPTVPPLALPKPATPEQQVVLPAAEQPEPKQEKQPKPETSKRPLAAFEEEAYQAFAQGKSKGHKNGTTKKPASAKAMVFKRPAAAKAKAKPSGHVEPPAAKRPSNQFQGLLGCIRCRGNKNGCATCIQPSFQGLRLPGREAWCKWHQGQPRSRRPRNEFLPAPQRQSHGVAGMQLESQAAGEPIPGAEAAIRAKPKKATMKKLIWIIYNISKHLKC